MKTIGKKKAAAGGVLIALFILWTALIQIIDVQPLGQNGTDIGFATVNCWFHRLTGVNMTWYTITDWMGLIPLLVCVIFAGIGISQWIRRRSLLSVDADILVLGAYYAAVIVCFFVFEIIPVNYRPNLIDGALEASYPSSTTLLVLGVMPTLTEQADRRFSHLTLRRIIRILTTVFCAFMVWGRLICGVHWLTDIVGSVLLCAGLFSLYQAAVTAALKND